MKKSPQEIVQRTRGRDTVVMGAGKNTFVGGVEVISTAGQWGVYGNQLWGVFTASPGLGITPPANYQGNSWNAATIVDQLNGKNDSITSGSASGTPFGTGNDTIFGGKGDSTYYFSNGDNGRVAVQQRGTHRRTLYGCNWLDAGTNLFGRIKREAANDAEGRMRA